MSARTLAALAAVVAVVWAAPSAAQEPPWDAEWVSPGAEPATVATPTDLAGWVRYDPPWTVASLSARVTYIGATPLPDGCPVELTAAEPAPPSSTATSTTRVGGDGRVDFLFPATATSPACNGTYVAVVTATTEPPGRPPDDVLARTLLVAIPPPPVLALQSTVNPDRTVALSWDPLAEPPLDHTGYLIERSPAGGEWEPRATVTPDVTSHADGDVPAAGGEFAYRVRAVRVGATADATVASSDAVTVTASIPAARPPVRRRSSRRSSTTAPPTTFDVVPESEVPESTEPGEDDPVLPDDADALGGPIVEHAGSGVDGRALAVPAATALVLVVWAAHIRYVAHLAARPRPITTWPPET